MSRIELSAQKFFATPVGAIQVPGAALEGAILARRADGGCADDAALGGEFEMLDPRGPGTGMDAPGLKFAGADGNAVSAAMRIKPRPGLLFLFPSWLLHQVLPYRGEKLRISVAFHFGIAPSAGG